MDKGSTEKKTGQLFKNLELSGEVEVTGIEPVSKHISKSFLHAYFRINCREKTGSGTNQFFP